MFSDQMSLLIPISNMFCVPPTHPPPDPDPSMKVTSPMAAYEDPGEVTGKSYSIPGSTRSLKGPKCLLSLTCLLSR